GSGSSAESAARPSRRSSSDGRGTIPRCRAGGRGPPSPPRWSRPGAARARRRCARRSRRRAHRASARGAPTAPRVAGARTPRPSWTRQDPRERLEVLRVGLEPADAVVVDRLHHRIVDGRRDTHEPALPAAVAGAVIDLRLASADAVLLATL